LIGAAQGSAELHPDADDRRDLLELPVVVFSWIAETISVERWEGTLEYTMMAPDPALVAACSARSCTRWRTG
jgi:hypothetical protein